MTVLEISDSGGDIHSFKWVGDAMFHARYVPASMSQVPASMSQLPCTRSHLPCPSFYLPEKAEYTSHSDWLHHSNFIYIVILNYILSSEQQNRPSQQGNVPRPGGCISMSAAAHVGRPYLSHPFFDFTNWIGQMGSRIHRL